MLECMLARERMRLHAVVPTFECVRTYTVLVDFNSFCVSSNRQTIRTSFRIVDGKEQETPGHNQTNYDRWKITNTPYSVSAYVDVIPLLSLL